MHKIDEDHIKKGKSKQKKEEEFESQEKTTDSFIDQLVNLPIEI